MPNDLKIEDEMKAIECCSKGDCDKCPNDDKKDCIGKTVKDALAIIYLYEQKVFELENRLKECENGYEGTLHLERSKLHDAEEKVSELMAENERLTNRIDEQCTNCDNMIVDRISTARDEAITEFAERVKKYYSTPKYQPTKEHPIKHTQIDRLLMIIDQIAKEMKGEKE